VPVARVRQPAELPGRTIALVTHGGDPLDLVLAGDDIETTIVVGAEREGLPDDVVAACDETATIPIAGGDSLNAAMAATIALYECSRRMARR
jgi:TrmH family RNA methyltransferase